MATALPPKILSQLLAAHMQPKQRLLSEEASAVPSHGPCDDQLLLQALRRYSGYR